MGLSRRNRFATACDSSGTVKASSGPLHCHGLRVARCCAGKAFPPPGGPRVGLIRGR
jgi:hypothetical protein